MVKLKSKKQSFELQLAAYSVIAAGVMANPINANAQILYTDLYEDVQKGDTANYIFDINEDSYHDLLVFSGFHDNGKFVNMQLGDSVEVLGSTYGYYFYPFALDKGVTVDGNNANWRDRDYGTMNWQSINDYGNWIGVEDKYIGMKIILNGYSYFGWARLDIAADAGKYIVKDYAFEFKAGAGIITGEAQSTYGITELTAIDVADNSNPSDMQISFRKAVEESKISEYRVILVKANDTIHVTPLLAMNVLSSNYIKVDKTGNDILFTLPIDTRDKDGDLIKNGVYYKPYILSIPDGVIETDPILSTNQRYVILHALSSEAGKPTVEDIGDNNNGSDVKVSFPKASNESKVDKYRVFIVKTDKVNDFTVDLAKSCGPSKFINVAKTGSDLVKTLDAAMRDTDGDMIKENTDYHVYVMSIADGTVASQNVLSPPSDVFKLTAKVSINNHIEQVDFNPYITENVLYLGNQSGITERSQIKVFNMEGKVCLSHTLQAQTSHIDHNLEKGIYLVVLYQSNKYYQKKVIVK